MYISHFTICKGSVFPTLLTLLLIVNSPPTTPESTHKHQSSHKVSSQLFRRLLYEFLVLLFTYCHPIIFAGAK